MRSVAIVLLLALAGCASQPVAEQVSKEPPKEYVLRGEVISIDEQIGTAKIRHEEIGDWMGPMTMEFPVKDAAELGRLQTGEYVEATLHVRGLDYWATDFKPAQPPAAAEPAPAPEK